MGKVGIVSYGTALPRRRLAVDEIIDLWKNTALDLVKEKQGVKERGVLGFDEDGNTFAVASAKEALKGGHLPEDIDTFYYGTCTNPYDSRPSGTMIAEALDLDYFTKVMDVQFSTKSGTTALISAAGNVAAGWSRNALVIGADTINRHTAPGDLLEPYASAGAGAVVLGKEKIIVEITAVESHSYDLSDGFRIEGERYIRSGMLLGSAKNEVGLYAQTIEAARRLMEKAGTAAADYTYGVFQQSTPATAFGIGKKLGFTDEQIQPSIYADVIGDTGSASALIGLAKVLDHAKAGEKILLVSYGFGSGADAVSLTVTEEISRRRNRAKQVDTILADKVMVDYKTAMKMEYKYIRHSYPLNAYL